MQVVVVAAAAAAPLKRAKEATPAAYRAYTSRAAALARSGARVRVIDKRVKWPAGVRTHRCCSAAPARICIYAYMYAGVDICVRICTVPTPGRNVRMAAAPLPPSHLYTHTCI